MDSSKIGAWFAGPKAEQGEFLADMLRRIAADYYGWRRNYFPEDGVVIDSALRRANESRIGAIAGSLGCEATPSTDPHRCPPMTFRVAPVGLVFAVDVPARPLGTLAGPLASLGGELRAHLPKGVLDLPSSVLHDALRLPRRLLGLAFSFQCGVADDTSSHLFRLAHRLVSVLASHDGASFRPWR